MQSPRITEAAFSLRGGEGRQGRSRSRDRQRQDLDASASERTICGHNGWIGRIKALLTSAPTALDRIARASGLHHEEAAVWAFLKRRAAWQNSSYQVADRVQCHTNTKLTGA